MKMVSLPRVAVIPPWERGRHVPVAQVIPRFHATPSGRWEHLHPDIALSRRVVSCSCARDARDACDKGMDGAEARCGTNCLQLSSLQSCRDLALVSDTRKGVARDLAAAQASEDVSFSASPEPLRPQDFS